MQKITSFTVDHEHLKTGLYVSRIDYVQHFPVTTLDIRMTRPNKDAVLSTGVMHTIEHIAATFLRNHKTAKDDVIYFGPMGCRTGFYLILQGNKNSQDCLPLVQEIFHYILSFSGVIPGAHPKECGNYTDMDFEGAKIAAKKYKHAFLDHPDPSQLVYPTT